MDSIDIYNFMCLLVVLYVYLSIFSSIFGYFFKNLLILTLIYFILNLKNQLLKFYLKLICFLKNKFIWIQASVY